MLLDLLSVNRSGNEPNGFTTENCVIGHTRTEQWIDIACNSENRQFCQLKDVIVNEGESVQLTCGVNNMQTSWTRCVNNTSVILSEYANGVSLTNLVFDHVKWSDQGNYECSFTNIDGLPETKFTGLFIPAEIVTFDHLGIIHVFIQLIRSLTVFNYD
ncbi:TTN [Mytilus coruscus]|uniref:TTN n=1 Tax=Mytilus coruscus TaxID=42192 RepID=A0A6J7ZYW5_MYTCO|nr:TTN [Mytilus coruscus]